MSFLKGLLRRDTSEKTAALIDIGAHSVSGAYAYYKEAESPLLVYARHLPIQTRPDEAPEEAMLRALKALGTTMIREGAPSLLRVSGKGSVDSVLISINDPWQKTHVRTERFEEDNPFVFTRHLLEARIAKNDPKTEGDVSLTDESLIGAVLNGYETHDPYGRSVHRASVILLSSLIHKTVLDRVTNVLRETFHANDIMPISGNSLRYQAARAMFPHERDAIIIDAIDRSSTSLTLVRHGLFTVFEQVNSAGEVTAWVADILYKLTGIAQQYPLPRTLFLLGKDTEIHTLQQGLTEADLGSLWLSDEPPKIVPILQKHLSGFVRQAENAESDMSVLLMAFFHGHRDPDDHLTASSNTHA